jgi:hypothetical protein
VEVLIGDGIHMIQGIKIALENGELNLKKVINVAWRLGK